VNVRTFELIQNSLNNAAADDRKWIGGVCANSHARLWAPSRSHSGGCPRPVRLYRGL